MGEASCGSDDIYQEKTNDVSVVLQTVHFGDGIPEDHCLIK